MHATLLLSLSLCHYTSFRLHDLPPISLLRSFSLSPSPESDSRRLLHSQTESLSSNFSLSVCRLPSRSLTRSPSCAFTVLFLPTHSAPSLLLFHTVFSWVDVIGIYRTLPERKRERTDIHCIMKNRQHNTPEQTHRATPEQSGPTQQIRAINNTTQRCKQTQGKWHHARANKYKTIHASEQTQHRANKHDTPHTQNYNIVNKNWRDQQHNSENKHPEESCHAKLLICNAKKKNSGRCTISFWNESP